MKNILFAALVAFSFLPGPTAEARISDASIQKLIKKVNAKVSKARAKRLKSGAILNYNISPDKPKQGDQVHLFASANTGFEDQELIVEGKLNDVAVALEHPATELWMLDLGEQHEIRSHKFEGTLYIQSKEDAAQIRDSILQLEGEISDLSQQIEEATDPTIIAQLTALRDQKEALKLQLVEALANLKSPVGTDTFRFRVRANATSPNHPQIAAVSPNVVAVNQAKVITVTGANFGASPSVTVGGTSVEVTASSATSITGNLPGIGTIGAKSVEVRFTQGSVVKNAILKNGLFVTADSVGGGGDNYPPVAVATAAQTQVIFGQAAPTFQSTGSYDPEGEPLNYEWRLISKPAASSIPVPTNPPWTGTDYSFGADVIGHYVVELRVFEQGGEQLASFPSLAVVEVIPPPNQAPVITEAPAIVTGKGVAGTSQLAFTDDITQTVIFSISTQPEHGTASVDSGSGLATYTPEAGYVGPDSFVVTATDDGVPALSDSESIQVTVVDNHAPQASAPPISVLANESGTSQISVTDEDTGQTFSYEIVTQPVRGTAEVSASGLVTYTSTNNFDNTDSIGVKITDNGIPNLSTTITIQVTTDGENNQPPQILNPLSFQIRTQGHPIQVGLSTSFAGDMVDPDGSIVRWTWDFGDGTQERSLDANFAFILHNYQQPGTYTARLTVTDNLGATAFRDLTFNVVDTDIPTVKFKADPSNGGGGAVPLTVTFDASEAFDADGITSYRWRWSSTSAEEVTTNPIITHEFTAPGEYQVRFRTRDANRAQGEVNFVLTVGSSVPGILLQPQYMAGPPRQVLLGQPINFDGSRSFNPNPMGVLADYLWDFTDFNCPDGCTANGVTASYTYPNAVNYFPGLRVQSGSGGLSSRVLQEVFAVNAGAAPKVVARSNKISGVAPLTVNFDSSESYDYDGAIETHDWHYRDGSPDPAPGAQVTHTFTTPGVYIPYVNVTDNDGNVVNTGLTITVTGSRADLPKKSVPYDSDREYQRQILATACGRGDGESCFQLAQMFAEDCDAFTAQKLREKACVLGYSAACLK